MCTDSTYICGIRQLNSLVNGRSVVLKSIIFQLIYLQKNFYLIDVYETFTSLVEKYDISPKLLKLEITETALMSEF